MSSNKWPGFENGDLPATEAGDAEMQRRWEVYDREMQVIIASGIAHQDDDGWWVETATGELIGPDPETERPRTDAELAQARPFTEALPDLAASIRRSRERLEAAVEAGARAFHDAARDKGSLRWETASEKWRQDMRDLVRPVVIAALDAAGRHDPGREG